MIGQAIRLDTEGVLTWYRQADNCSGGYAMLLLIGSFPFDLSSCLFVR